MKHTCFNLVVLLLAAGPFLTGCMDSQAEPQVDSRAAPLTGPFSDPKESQRKIYQAELEGYQLARNTLFSELNGLKTTLATYQNEKQNLNIELENYQRKTRAYIMNHKMAVAAIALGVAGVNVAIDEDNTFSQDAKDMGTVVGLLAIAYALGNMEEIMEVADVINQADSYVKDLEGQMAGVDRKLINMEEKINFLNNDLQKSDALISETMAKISAY